MSVGNVTKRYTAPGAVCPDCGGRFHDCIVDLKHGSVRVRDCGAGPVVRQTPSDSPGKADHLLRALSGTTGHPFDDFMRLLDEYRRAIAVSLACLAAVDRNRNPKTVEEYKSLVLAEKRAMDALAEWAMRHTT
jgi:Zn ribbon nucleic-acid-binding protein